MNEQFCNFQKMAIFVKKAIYRRRFSCFEGPVVQARKRLLFSSTEAEDLVKKQRALLPPLEHLWSSHPASIEFRYSFQRPRSYSISRPKSAGRSVPCRSA